MEIRKNEFENYENKQGVNPPFANPNPNPPSQLFGGEPVNTNLNTGLFDDSELKGYELKAAAAGTAFENAQTNYDSAVSADGIADTGVEHASDFLDTAQSNLDSSEKAAKNADTNATNAQAAVDTAQTTLGSLTAGLGAAQANLSIAKAKLDMARTSEDESAIAAANQMVQGTEQQIASINESIQEARDALSDRVQEAADAEIAKLEADKQLEQAELAKNAADKDLKIAQETKAETEAKVVETEAALKTAQEDKQAADAEYNEAIQRAEEKAREEAAAAEERARQEAEAARQAQEAQTQGFVSGEPTTGTLPQDTDAETETVDIVAQEIENEGENQDGQNDDPEASTSDYTSEIKEEDTEDKDKEEMAEDAVEDAEISGDSQITDNISPSEEDNEEDAAEEKATEEIPEQAATIEEKTEEEKADEPVVLEPEQPAWQEPEQTPVEEYVPEVAPQVEPTPVVDVTPASEPAPVPQPEVVPDVQPSASQADAEVEPKEDTKTSMDEKVIDYDDPDYIPSSFDEAIKHDLVISDEAMANSLAKVLDLDCSPEVVSDAVGLSTKEAILSLYESQQASLYDSGYVTKVSKNTDTATVDEHRNAESDFWDSFASATEIMMKKTNKGDIDTSEISSVKTSDINDNELLASENSTYDAARNIAKRISQGQYVIAKELTDITRKLTAFVASHQDDNSDAGNAKTDAQKKKEEKK